MGKRPYTAVKTFTATMKKDRDVLGERITAWLEQNADMSVVNKHVGLSSGKDFHCLTISLFLAKSGS